MKNEYYTDTRYGYTSVDLQHELPTWKPRILRPPSIAVLIVSILAVIGLLEGAARRLPHKSGTALDTLFNQSAPSVAERDAVDLDPTSFKSTGRFGSSSYRSSQNTTDSGQSEYPIISELVVRYLNTSATASITPESAPQVTPGPLSSSTLRYCTDGDVSPWTSSCTPPPPEAEMASAFVNDDSVATYSPPQVSNSPAYGGAAQPSQESAPETTPPPQNILPACTGTETAALVTTCTSGPPAVMEIQDFVPSDDVGTYSPSTSGTASGEAASMDSTNFVGVENVGTYSPPTSDSVQAQVVPSLTIPSNSLLETISQPMPSYLSTGYMASFTVLTSNTLYSSSSAAPPLADTPPGIQMTNVDSSIYSNAVTVLHVTSHAPTPISPDSTAYVNSEDVDTYIPHAPDTSSSEITSSAAPAAYLPNDDIATHFPSPDTSSTVTPVVTPSAYLPTENFATFWPPFTPSVSDPSIRPSVNPSYLNDGASDIYIQPTPAASTPAWVSYFTLLSIPPSPWTQSYYTRQGSGVTTDQTVITTRTLDYENPQALPTTTSVPSLVDSSTSSAAYVDLTETVIVTQTPSFGTDTRQPDSSTYVTGDESFTISPSGALRSQYVTDDQIVTTEVSFLATTVYKTQTITTFVSPQVTGLGNNRTATQTITFIAIMNSENPWFNSDLWPTPEDPGQYTIFVTHVIWPAWAAFFGSGALAVIVATILYEWWSIYRNQINLLEPFACLAKANGALARHTLFQSLAGHSLFADPIKGFQSKRWVYFWASLTSLLFTLLASLASEVLTTDTHGCSEPPPDYAPRGDNICPPQLTVEIQALRALQALLAVIAAIILTIGTLLHFRRTNGVLGDPSSIAMAAALLNHPETVRMLRSIPPDAPLREMEAILGPYSFTLAMHESEDGTWRYGIVPLEEFVPEETSRKPVSKRWNEKTWYLWLQDAFLAILLVGLLGVIVAYYNISDQKNRFNLFFNSQNFGARFILTGAGSIIKVLWEELHTKVYEKCILARLSKGNANAKRTVLARRSPTSITSIIPSLLNRQFLASAVAFSDFLAFALVVALPGIPYSTGQEQKELVICSYISMSILATLIVVFLLAIIWRRRLPNWPRQPQNLAALLSYLVDSDMLNYFDKASELGPKDAGALKSIGTRKWAFDRCTGPDDVVRWTILAEESETLMAPTPTI